MDSRGGVFSGDGIDPPDCTDGVSAPGDGGQPGQSTGHDGKSISQHRFFWRDEPVGISAWRGGTGRPADRRFAQCRRSEPSLSIDHFGEEFGVDDPCDIVRAVDFPARDPAGVRLAGGGDSGTDGGHSADCRGGIDDGVSEHADPVRPAAAAGE